MTERGAPSCGCGSDLCLCLPWKRRFIFGFDIRAEPFGGSTPASLRGHTEWSDGEPAEHALTAHGHGEWGRRRRLFFRLNALCWSLHKVE